MVSVEDESHRERGQDGAAVLVVFVVRDCSN